MLTLEALIQGFKLSMFALNKPLARIRASSLACLVSQQTLGPNQGHVWALNKPLARIRASSLGFVESKHAKLEALIRAKGLLRASNMLNLKP